MTDYKNKTMNDYADYSEKDLEELRDRLTLQSNNLEETIREVNNALKIKRCALGDLAIAKNPYYKDKSVVIKIIVSKGSYIVTRIKSSGICISVDQITQHDTNFLKYYKMCSKIDWDRALSNLNYFFKNSNLSVNEYK